MSRYEGNNKAHLRPKDFDRNGDIISDSVREWAGCGGKLCKYCEDYDGCMFTPNDIERGDNNWPN